MILGDLLRTLLGGMFRGRRQGRSQRQAISGGRPFLPKYSAPEKSKVPSFFFPTFWGTTDDRGVTESMKSVTQKLEGGYYFADNLLTWVRNLSMFDDGPFLQAWKDNVESDSDKAIVWRRYVLACAAYHCVQLEGDFVECGAYTGVGVKTIVDYLGGPAFPKTFWCYDLFDHDSSMLNHAMPEHGESLYARVCEKFMPYSQVQVMRGKIPEVFASGCPERIAYLHIDLNQAPAEIAALEHLFDRMVPGGILILDDYEWAGAYRGQKIAEDAWFDERQYRVMPLPTGQGLVIKR
jgi:O-methyltransferase